MVINVSFKSSLLFDLSFLNCHEAGFYCHETKKSSRFEEDLANSKLDLNSD